jgi:hypothetical protein
VGEPAAPAPNVATKPKPAFHRRFREWLWRTEAAAELNAALPAWSAAREYRRRARLAAEVAERTLLAPARPDAESADGLACEFYRQSLHWALLASAGKDAEGDADFVTLFRRADRALLAAAAGGEAALGALEPLLLDGSFERFTALAPDERARLAFSLRPFVDALLQRLDLPQTELGALRVERVLRVGFLVLLVVVPLVGLVALLDLRDEGRDLAAKRPWRASSAALQACRSPKQFCDESPSYFFHTNEDANPWVEIDLGRPMRFSEVRLVNRTDCCRDRATPLVIEVGNDQSKWKQVARRDRPFRTFKAEFQPLTARYVRVRATRKTFLHLSRVLVLP